MVKRHYWDRDDKEVSICPHCNKKIRDNPILRGLTTLCPYCKKPYQGGGFYGTTKKEEDEDN